MPRIKIRYGLLLNLLVFSVFALCVGVNRWREAAGNENLKTLTYAQVTQESPSNGWVRITGCRIDLSQAVEDTQNNVPVRLYAPVFDLRNPQQQTTRLFAEIDDHPAIHLVFERDEMARSHTPQEVQAWTAAHRAEFLRTADLTGLVHKGIRRPTEDLDRIFNSLAEVPVSELVVVASGWEPDMKLAHWLTGAGIFGLLVFIAGYGRLSHKW